MRNPKLWITIIALVVVGVIVKLTLPFSVPAVRASVAIAPEILFTIAGFDVTPTIITSVIVFIIIVVWAFSSTRNMQLVPSGAQNLMETAIEQMINLFESIAGPMWPKFFTIAATIFILALVSNFFEVVPGAGSIGFIKLEPGESPPPGIVILGDAPSFIQTTSLHERNVEASGSSEQIQQSLVPILRAPTTDINLPLAMALVSVIMTQIFGMQVQGILKYWTRFFSFGRLLKGDIAFGLIDVFVGIVELVSEISKIVSFTFRLFGNIFAGDVVLLIMSFLFLLLPFPFYGLEFFVIFIQAFVFAVLTVAFMRLATAEHGAEQGHTEAAHH